ncbi:hypothetical protein [Mesorhizobium carmichaelinearum]|uniref:hypothetical protein n=1 Tax=Mesorhizobium carmichaelinearum TaxID=1208188 RepID=UPI000BA47805|nr:hypothetical protein [Mesorhizobium carmichaelinearum]
MNKLIAIPIVGLVFVVGFMAVIVSQKGRPRPPPYVTLSPFTGHLNIPSIDDLRVGGRKIVLCGAASTKPMALRGMVTDAARRDFQGMVLNCKPVGSGTPCDGKTGTMLGDAVVVQCLMPDGGDLAAVFTQKGLLCGQPGQIGAIYKAC